MEGKRLLFCLTPGRTGTGYLARMLNLCPGVHADHEGPVDMVDAAREARQNYGFGGLWWLNTKLPYIDNLECKIYADTSHLFGKGMVKSLLDLGHVPDAVVLRRPAREVALSYWRREAIPGRTRDGLWYLLHPAAAHYYPFPQWDRATPYQLCFWYVLEMEGRMVAAAEAIRNAGGRAFETSTADLTGGAGFHDLVCALELPPPDWAEYRCLKAERVNENPPGMRGLYPPGDLDEQEQGVLDSIEAAIRSNEPPEHKPALDVAILHMNYIRANLVELELGLTQYRGMKVGITHSTASPIPNNRCQIAREYRLNEAKADWLLMIDDDTVPTGDFLQWCDDRLDVVIFPAPCWKPAEHPDDPIVWNVKLLESDQWTEDGRLPNPAEYPLIEVAGGGTGAILIHRRVLEHPNLRAPFRDHFDENGLRSLGEDLDFCEQARAAGFRIWAALANPCRHHKEVDLLTIAQLIKNKERGALQRAIEG